MPIKPIAEQMQELLQKDKSVSADGVSVTRHSVQDLIAADKYLSKKRCANRLQLNISRFRSPTQ